VVRTKGLLSYAAGDATVAAMKANSRAIVGCMMMGRVYAKYLRVQRRQWKAILPRHMRYHGLI
jgi:hypothetical protein